MRVLLLSRYDRLGSSSRLRHYQFQPALADAGIEVDVEPLLPDAYLSVLYAGGRKPIHLVFAAYVHRVLRLLKVRKYDLLWIEKEVLPWLPYGFEHLLLKRLPPYVIDFDDAWFHVYDQHPNQTVRSVMGHKLDSLMRGAALVTVGNAYLVSRALRAGASRIRMLPTVIDLPRYNPIVPPPDDRFVIGWIGSPVTSRYLDLVRGPLGALKEERGAEVVLVGAKDDSLACFPAERRRWREETEVADIATFNVGIMPLANTPWERGKCGYKLIQYMACARPVVATPVGVNRDLVDHGVNGFLAETPEEWHAALSRLRDDPELCRRMGAAGRAKVEKHFTLERVAPTLVDAMRKAGGVERWADEEAPGFAARGSQLPASSL